MYDQQSQRHRRLHPYQKKRQRRGLDALPTRMQDIMVEASQIQSDPAAYHHALMDWVEQGEASEFALSEAAVIERSKPQSDDRARGHAHFELASEAAHGHKELAVKHFRAAHALVPDSWTFRRQAWSLEPVDAAGPLHDSGRGLTRIDPKRGLTRGIGCRIFAPKGQRIITTRSAASEPVTASKPCASTC